MKIINKKSINIGKFEIKLNNKTYIIFTDNNKIDNFTEFYITEKESTIILFCTGLIYTEITNNIINFISDNINTWVNYYEKHINYLEEMI